MEKQTVQQNRAAGVASVVAPSYKNCIQLAACAANQILPMNPDLPADIFTSCLTTPITIALRWFVMQNTSKLVPKVSLDLIDKWAFNYKLIITSEIPFLKTFFFMINLVYYLTSSLVLFHRYRIPGQLTDRRTMLGELNWIFTAITDTIAWNTLPRGEDIRLRLSDIFKKVKEKEKPHYFHFYFQIFSKGYLDKTY